MDKLLINDSGQLWRSGEGKLIRGRVFSQDVLQDGLVFWGAADPNYLTLVSDGVNQRVSEAYDIRGNGLNMIQNTLVDRPLHLANYIQFANKEFLSMAAQSAKSMFIVMKLNATTLQWKGIGLSTTILGAHAGGNFNNLVSTTPRLHYINLISKTGSTPYNINRNIFHTLFDTSIVNQIMRVGSVNTETYIATYNIYEWGWYNRVLTEHEVIYNINALNAKYSIF
jgi:hypothetical protein